MKVLAIIAIPEFGSTETHVVSLSKALKRHGIGVTVATYGGPYVQVMRRQGITVHKIPRSKRLSTTAAARYISTIVKGHGYSIIHAHDIESFGMLRHLSKELPHVPRVITVHGTYFSSTELKRASRACNRVIAVSRTVRKRLIRAGCPSSKVKWIPNGIHVQVYSPKADSISRRRKLRLPEKGHICLYVGRLQSDKWRIARKFILASERVARNRANVVSVVVGYGAYRAQLSKLAKRVNTRLGRKAVRVLPPTTQIQNYYRSATLVVGTGRVALEAMSCAKPVIAAGIAGYEGIVTQSTWKRNASSQFGDNRASGEITVRRLANDMKKLIRDERLNKSAGKFGRNMVVRRFSVVRTAKLTSGVYRKVTYGGQEA
ncbi:glycosyltransferase [Alicyclobacillus fastidiosus]|uniref:Glycosyltransferase n=1 Tax=Alicyclobacillus fastidiosus TaxID=392011 RepID=A0ABY6ZAX7_9BACL|nr:glycosyltransferase [Alicyclobacillus fastidiosus]WAH40021.1 glycosyltransferase [Alicyclobacillus fastidiosus]GMA61319.1 hypothetical protein GCM10025859_17590 [Alicyclobacillus fastidiosus]